VTWKQKRAAILRQPWPQSWKLLAIEIMERAGPDHKTPVFKTQARLGDEIGYCEASVKHAELGLRKAGFLESRVVHRGENFPGMTYGPRAYRGRILTIREGWFSDNAVSDYPISRRAKKAKCKIKEPSAFEYLPSEDRVADYPNSNQQVAANSGEDRVAGYLQSTKREEANSTEDLSSDVDTLNRAVAVSPALSPVPVPDHSQDPKSPDPKSPVPLEPIKDGWKNAARCVARCCTYKPIGPDNGMCKTYSPMGKVCRTADYTCRQVLIHLLEKEGVSPWSMNQQLGVPARECSNRLLAEELAELRLHAMNPHDRRLALDAQARAKAQEKAGTNRPAPDADGDDMPAPKRAAGFEEY
jgi:hypothetical protein